MEEDSETCVFRWYVHNPFLPSETKEAIFCFGLPKITQWKAFLQLGKGRRAVNNWPVSFSLQYFPPDEADDKEAPEEASEAGDKATPEVGDEEASEAGDKANPEVGDEEALEVDVSVNFVGVGNKIPSHEHFVFNRENDYTYTYDSSIRPEHGKLEIIVEILIPRRYKEAFLVPPNDLEELSYDLKLLRSDNTYFDMWLQSKDPDIKFPVHSCILDARWNHFKEVWLAVEPNSEERPTVETDILPEVLDDILTYLYTGSLKHFHLGDPNFEEYRTELFQTIDKYPLHHLYMMFDPNPKCQTRITMTHLSTSAMTFRLEEPRYLGPYTWTHSPLPGVSVTTSVELFGKEQIKNKSVVRPYLCYKLRFTNAIKLSARVNLEYRRKVVGWDSEMRRVLYECDYEIPCNANEVVFEPFILLVGSPSHLLKFTRGEDRREGGHKVEHSLRFILYLSTGDGSIKTSRLDEIPHDEWLSLIILSKHMSIMRRRKIRADLKVTLLRSPYRSVDYHLHKAIFAIRCPKWQDVVPDVPIPDFVDEEIQIGGFDHFFKFVAEFLYAGTCSPIREEAWLHEIIFVEIIKFARQSGCNSLQDYALEYMRPPGMMHIPMELE